MRALSASQLLNVWERGLGQDSVQRALALLAAACPDTPFDTLAGLSIGRRDASLLTLREWAFGPRLVSLAVCPACGERLELGFNVEDIRLNPEPESTEMHSYHVAGYEVQFRLPNSMDLAVLSSNSDVAGSRQQLLRRCLYAAQCNGQEISTDQLPAGIVEATIDQMAQVDPQADIQLLLTCPACHHGWQALFDVVSFFWSEINAWAVRVLHEVHRLATAYGWGEAEILAMSPQRRQFYLEMASQ